MKAALVAVLLTAALAHADSWRPPARQKYFSKDRTYRVEIIPANGTASAKTSTARAVFSARGALGLYRTRASFALLNQIAPTSAIVSVDGKHLATFNNWGSVGYGNAVVIYRTDGSVVARFDLEDLFTTEDLKTFSTSVSSRWWGHGHHFDDQERLVLRYVNNGKESWDPDATFGELPIDLATGKPVSPKRDLLTAFHPPPPPTFIRLLPAPDPLPALSSDSGMVRCAEGAASGFDPADRTSLPSAVVVQGASEAALPLVYPPLARMARIQGTVVADLLLSPEGKVTCARLRAGHPLLRAAALDGLLALRVDPSLVRDPSATTVTIDFALGR